MPESRAVSGSRACSSLVARTASGAGVFSIEDGRTIGMGRCLGKGPSASACGTGRAAAAPGVIAAGIGRNACEAGYKVLFVNAKELVDQLYEDMQKGYLKETLKQISKIPLLIIDELSYLKMDKERESLFFQIIRQRYEKSSLIITTNLPMGRWDELFTGKLAAAAILDRLVHHCHVISITGDSYRVKGPKTEY